jgi:P27 family predicted phage terminase small subunit
MRGRPPKPTAIKRSEGNPGKRKLSQVDLALEPQMPRCPRWLDREGKRIWRELSAELFTLGVLRNSDKMMLANLCDAYSLMLSARRSLEQLQEQTRMLVRTGASLQQNPLISIINRQRGIIHRIASEFGMTPAARAKLLGGGDGPLDGPSLEDLIAGDGSDPRFAEPPPEPHRRFN